MVPNVFLRLDLALRSFLFGFIDLVRSSIL